MLKKKLKALLRSRSARFTRDLLAVGSTHADGNACNSVSWWNGDGRPVHYRCGTSDVGLVYDILFKPGRRAEYWLPAEVSPRVVFDIGANIGVTARYLAQRFPHAEIHGFEPIPANVEVLRANAEGAPIHVHPYGLRPVPLLHPTGRGTGWIALGAPNPLPAPKRSAPRYAPRATCSLRLTACNRT
ncbi:MAG: FkbM family methyltransferase [Betaproteobacteria bacterium]|nr:FkbM family methyltransferase [Betaproteobacteria bacterium]